MGWWVCLGCGARWLCRPVNGIRVAEIRRRVGRGGRWRWVRGSAWVAPCGVRVVLQPRCSRVQQCSRRRRPLPSARAAVYAARYTATPALCPITWHHTLLPLLLITIVRESMPRRLCHSRGECRYGVRGVSQHVMMVYAALSPMPQRFWRGRRVLPRNTLQGRRYSQAEVSRSMVKPCANAGEMPEFVNRRRPARACRRVSGARR